MILLDINKNHHFLIPDRHKKINFHYLRIAETISVVLIYHVISVYLIL